MKRILASSDSMDQEQMSAMVKKNFARVEIYFETMNFQRFQETPKYNPSTLFGTLGGNMGLWLGWSVFAVFEILQWGYRVAAIALSRSPSKNL